MHIQILSVAGPIAFERADLMLTHARTLIASLNQRQPKSDFAVELAQFAALEKLIIDRKPLAVKGAVGEAVLERYEDSLASLVERLNTLLCESNPWGGPKL